LEEYRLHLQPLISDLEIRFKDLIDLGMPAWVTNPFIFKEKNQELGLQEEIIEVQNDEQSK
jgi:hypothetical protein